VVYPLDLTEDHMKHRRIRALCSAAALAFLTLTALPSTPASAQLNDNVFDNIAITSPTTNQTLPGLPVVITGTAFDVGRVATVRVAIYRSFPVGGQYWNGSAWQSGYIDVAATLNAPGTVTTSWSYAFGGNNNGGRFYVAAIGRDTSGNTKATSPFFRPFNTTDTVAPTGTVTVPANGRTYLAREKPISFLGTVQDNQSIYDAQMVIWRPIRGGQFWDGTNWQNTFVTAPVTQLLTRGNAAATWGGAFNPPQNGGTYYLAVLAVDGSLNTGLSAFSSFTIVDTTAPTATLTTPLNGSTTTFTGNKIEGTATDNGVMASVGLAVYRTATNEYWNGSSWTSSFSTFPALLETPGEASTVFRGQINLTPGTYLVAAIPVDANNNYSFSGWNTVTRT
jgi:hypothetical protein